MIESVSCRIKAFNSDHFCEMRWCACTLFTLDTDLALGFPSGIGAVKLIEQANNLLYLENIHGIKYPSLHCRCLILQENYSYLIQSLTQGYTVNIAEKWNWSVQC